MGFISIRSKALVSGRPNQNSDYSSDPAEYGQGLRTVSTARPSPHPPTGGVVGMLPQWARPSMNVVEEAESMGEALRRRLGPVVTAALLASGAVTLVPGGHASLPGVMSAAHAAGIRAPAAPDYDRLALDTLDEVLRDDFAAVSSRFDEALRSQASPEFLAKSWKDYQEAFGAYRSHGDPEQVSLREGTVVRVPLRMAERPGEFRVTFDEDGQITGLYFLRAGVPAP